MAAIGTILCNIVYVYNCSYYIYIIYMLYNIYDNVARVFGNIINIAAVANAPTPRGMSLNLHCNAYSTINLCTQNIYVRIPIHIFIYIST